MLGQLWPIVIARQHDIGKALIITKQNIETRHHRLDEIRFKQERFDLCPCGDDLHRSGFSHHPHQPCAKRIDPGIAHDPLVERFCLADVKRLTGMIKHAINPGLAAQLFCCLTDHPEATFEIRAGLGGIRRGRVCGGFFCHIIILSLTPIFARLLIIRKRESTISDRFSIIHHICG